MRYTKYLFTPYDLARFIYFGDLSVKRSNEILKNLFDGHNAEILSPYRDDFLLFHKRVTDLVNEFSVEYDELDEAQSIMREINGASTEQTSEPDVYCAYFKLVKLRLMYTNEYIRLKMSTLLSVFGYKRRSQQLMSTIKAAIKKLNLVPYTRGYELCDIGNVDIHTMIMFRLAASDEVVFCDDLNNDDVVEVTN